MKLRSDSPTTRRAVLGGAAIAGAGIISTPYIRNAEAAETTTWKVQTSWPAGVAARCRISTAVPTALSPGSR